jgi:hypothetical protein
MRAGELKNGCVKLYDEGKDQMVAISGETLFKKSCLENTDYGGTGQPSDCNEVWNKALKCDTEFETISSHFWGEFWECDDVKRMFNAKTDFETWFRDNNAVDDTVLTALGDQEKTWYQPRVLRFLLAGKKLYEYTRDDLIKLFDGKNLVKAKEDEKFISWASWVTSYRATEGGSHKFGNIIFQGMKGTSTGTGNLIPNADDVYGDIETNSHYERLILPFYAHWTKKVSTSNYKQIFDRDDASSPMKYNLFLLRPTIEHSMIGCVVGRGGAEDLGATLWGQTELSCYDDAMHGKWGMNYKLAPSYTTRSTFFDSGMWRLLATTGGWELLLLMMKTEMNGGHLVCILTRHFHTVILIYMLCVLMMVTRKNIFPTQCAFITILITTRQ